MHIISESTLQAFADEHADAAALIAIWVKRMRPQHFRTTHDVKAVFASADFLPNGVVVFDLGKSQYRISTNIRYVTDRHRVGRVYIRYVLTHDDYDRRSRAGTL